MTRATGPTILMLLFLGSAVSPASGFTAGGSGAARESLDSFRHDTQSNARGQLLLHGFTTEDMRNAYGLAYGAQGSFTGWWGTSGRIGLRVDLALWGAEGEAKILDESWTVTKRKVGVGTIETSVTALYRLREPDNARMVMPYAGIGLGGVFGFDQLWFAFNRSGEYHEGHSALTFRPAFEAHGLLGTVIPMTASFSLVAEVLWIQAGKAPLTDIWSVSEEEELVRSFVCSVLKYPDMNITGWRALVGLQYAW